MHTVAALLLASALWAGCLAGGPLLCAPAALVVLASALWPALRDRSAIALVLVVVATALLGMGLAGGRQLLSEASPLVTAARHHATLTVRGRVVTEPRATPYGSWVLLRVSHADGRSTSARVLLHLEIDAGVAVGQPLATSARVGPLPEGAFGAYLRSAGVVAAADPVAQVELGTAPAAIAMTTTIRRRATRVFDATLPPTQAALLGGLVLGSRDGVPTDELAASGLSHLVVVSGHHVAVLLAALVVATGACGLGLRGRSRVALVVVWWFVLLTRWEPSVVRAAVMASACLIATLRGRTRDTAHTLAMTVILLLLLDPLLARRIGFVLSILATAGVLGAVRWAGRGRGRRPSALLAATVGAQIATAPVILMLAGSVPVAALPANLIAGPAAAVAQVVGSGAAALAAVELPGAAGLARAAGIPLAVLWWAATAFVWLPPLQAPHVVAVVCVPLVALTLRAPRVVVVGATVAAVATVTVILRLPPPAPDALQLTVFDVGQGDGLLVETPGGDGGARMVVDGGPDTGTVARLLSDRRIRALDAVVLTHGDHDHSGGVAEILRRLDVAALLLPSGAGSDPNTLSDSAVEAVAVARAQRIPVIGLRAGTRFMLGASVVDVLAPAGDLPAGAERNTASVVLRIAGRHGRMLLTGDADALAQQELLGRPHLLRAEVLKVPHHGGATNADGFLDAVHATVAVVSLGRNNSHGHPHPATLADLAPVPVWRTDRHGAVTVTLSAGGPVVRSEVYTARDARPTADVSVHRLRGAAGPASRRAPARRAAGRGTHRGHRRARRRPARAGAARPAHRFAVRRSACRAHP